MKILLMMLLVASDSVSCAADVQVGAPTPSNTTSATYYPFLIKQDSVYPSSFSMRFQQVYSGSLFKNIDSRLINITQLAFEVASTNSFGGIIFTITNMQINLSTTSKSADGLNINLNENVGTDDKIVFGPNKLSYRGGLDSTLFINLDRPFRYDPASGNLLM